MTKKPTTESAENPQHSHALKYVTPAELELYRQDPALEARLGISDYVVCRVCGAMPKFHMSGKKGHLWARHKKSTQQYRGLYPGARLCSFKVTARNAIRRPGRCSDVRKLMAMFADTYVTPQELDLYRNDPAREVGLGISDYVVCRVCGAKISMRLSGCRGAHLPEHGLNLTEYRRLWPGAPGRSAKNAKAVSKASYRWAKRHPDRIKKHHAKYLVKPGIKEKRGAYSRDYARQVREFAKIGRQLSQRGQYQPGASKPKKKTGPKTGDNIGPEIDHLEKQGLKWHAIKEHMDTKTGVYRSIDAYQGLLKRWRARKTRQNALSNGKPSN